MFEASTRTILKTKYNIDPSNYSEKEQIKILEGLITRNDKIIDINNEKIKLYSEIIGYMTNYLNGGEKVVSK